MDAKSTFDTGDIVQLKSGGPDMTVTEENDYNPGTFDCQWFAGRKLESGSFPIDSLVLSKDVKKKS